MNLLEYQIDTPVFILQKEQLTTQEAKIIQLQEEWEEHKNGQVPTKGLALQNYKEKDAYLHFEVIGLKNHNWNTLIQSFFKLKRYRTYVDILSSRLLASGDKLDGDELVPETSPQKLTDVDISASATTSSYHHTETPLTNEEVSLRTGSEKDLLISASAIGSSTANRYSYRAAIYHTDAQQDLIG